MLVKQIYRKRRTLRRGQRHIFQLYWDSSCFHIVDCVCITQKEPKRELGSGQAYSVTFRKDCTAGQTAPQSVGLR